MFTLAFLFVSCVVLIVGGLAQNNLECGPNEIVRCVECPFEDTCYDRDQILCLAVISGCKPRCVCKEGFIRKTLDSECIPKEECGSPCMIFESYTDCKESFNETCSTIVTPTEWNSDNKEACTPGCACWDGYYRADANSPCLHRCLCDEMINSPDCE